MNLPASEKALRDEYSRRLENLKDLLAKEDAEGCERSKRKVRAQIKNLYEDELKRRTSAGYSTVDFLPRFQCLYK